MGNLCVPDEFVGIHRCIAVTSTAVHGQIGGNLRAPRHSERGVHTIGEAPGIEVRLRLQLVA